MALQTATNPQTGESVALVNGNWQPIAQTATNPQTGERVGLIGNEWMPLPSAAPKPVTPTAKPASDDFDFGSPMGTGAEEIIEARTKPKEFPSVFDKVDVKPATLPGQNLVNLGGVSPKYVNALEGQFNALPEAQRTAALQKSIARTPENTVAGRALRAIAERNTAWSAAPKSVSKLDPRLEAQTQRFVEQGIAPEEAVNYAKQSAEMGEIRPDFQQMTADVVGEQADVAAKARAKELENAGLMGRVGAGAASQFKKSGLGLANIYADALGYSGISKELTNERRIEEAREGAIPQGKSILEKSAQGALTSLATQAPLMVLGTITGTSAPILAQALIQQLGDSYGEGKAAGLSGGAAFARAAPTAIAEVFFERFGMTKALAGLKGHLAKYGPGSIYKYMGEAIAAEIPPELATTLAQYGIDVLPGIGLNKNPSLIDLYKQLEETVRQTVLQAGVTSAATIGGAKVAQKSAQALLNFLPKGEQEQEGTQEEKVQIPTPPETPAPPSAPPVAPPAPPVAQTEAPVAPTPPETPAPPVAPPAPPVAPTPPAPPTALSEVKVDEAAGARRDRINEATEQLEQMGIPTDNAKGIATRQVDAALTAEAKTAAIKIPEGRVEEITQDLISAGVAPQQAAIDAQRLAQDEAETDAKAETEGAQDVTRPNAEPDRAGVPVAGEATPAPSTTGEPTAVERDGVVPAEQNVGEPVAGEIVKPTPVDRFVSNFGGTPWTYFFPGAEVVQMQYPGAPAKVVGVEEKEHGQPTTYTLEVDVSKHPDGVDDNGDRVNTKTVRVRDDELNRFNPPNETAAPAGEAAVQAAPTEITTETEGTPSATETPETQQAKTQKQKAPAAAGVTPAKRGRPAVKQTHVVAANPEGGFNHVASGEVVATYANKKQATAAVDLAKAQDKGDAALIAKNQTRLDAAMASQGRGRPAGTKTEGKTKRITATVKADLAELDSALEAYNSPDSSDKKVRESAEYIYEVANDAGESDVVRNHAQQMVDDQIAEEHIPSGAKPSASTAKIKAALAATGKRALPSKFTNAPANTDFSKVTNASEAVGLIVKTGTLFQRFVAQRLRSSVVGIKFVVLEKGDAIPDEMDNARGLFEYNPGTNKHVIYVRGASFGDMQGVNNVTVLHELLHAATARRIEAGLSGGPKNVQLTKFMDEMQTLMKRVEAAYESGVRRGIISAELQDLVEADAENTKYDENDNPKFEIFNSPHEFLAYGMSSDEFQRFLMRIKGTRTSETGFTKFVTNIRDLFGVKSSEATAFTDLVNITDDVLNTTAGVAPTQGQAFQQKKKFKPPVFDEKEDIRVRRSAKKLARDTQIAKAKVAASREGNIGEATEEMQKARDPVAAREIIASKWDDLSYAVREQIVKLPTFDVLVRLAADKGIPTLLQVDTQLGQMLGMSQKFLGGANQMIDMLKRGFKEDSSLSRTKFEDFVYATTLAEIDPSDPNAVERSKDLDKDYKALGAVGQRMYKQLKSYYESIIELYSDLLDAQINNIQGMSPDEKNNLMLVLRKTFEAKARITPFFPLVRRGDYWLAIGEGAERQFYLFETRADRNAKAKELAARQGDSLEDLLFQQKFEQGNDLGSLRAASKDSSAMLKQVFEAIDKMEFGGADSNAAKAKEGLKDAVYQVYLTTMPEQSFRRQFTHRKGRTGFSTDLQRNIATTAAKQAIQLSRLKYAPLLRNALSQAKDSIREREELSPFVQEAEKRINLALSGQSGGLGEAVAGIANKASYFWYLSGVSSALIQPASVFISGLPILAANHNNAVGAGLELAKMATLVNQYSVFRKNIDGTTSIVAPSLANNKSLPADERKAISEMVSRGVTQSTYASLVWGYKSMSTEASEGIRGKGKRLANLMVGALMHNTERLSREAVYLASYRLGRKRGLSYEEAVQQAADDTNEALGNYDITNRPRFMQQGLGKVAFQFKMYPLQMTLLLLTNFKRMIVPLNGEGRKAAITKFFGMMGTSFLVGGVANMALFSPIMGLLGWAWGAMGKDDDWPEELKGLNFEVWFKTVFLPEKLGDISVGGVPLSDLVERGPLNALTGWEIAARIGLNDLWGRDSKETKTSRDSAIAFMLDHMAGPTGSLVLSFADAYDAYAMGDYQKMQEKLLPAAARNLSVTNRIANEGMKTARGMELVTKDDVKLGELIGQAIGFQPDLLSATQVNSFKLTGIEQRIVNQRAMILNKLDFQYRQDTDAADEKFDKILEDEVTKFNTKYPSYALDPDAIVSSLEKKAEQRAGSRAGVIATEKNVPIIEQATDTMEARLDRRAAEMKARREKAK